MAKEPKAAKRTPVCEKAFHLEGVEDTVKHAAPDAIGLEFAFTNNAKEIVTLDDLPQNIRDALAWHGLSQKLGDSYAGAKGSAEDAYEAFMSVLERLKVGDWVKAREGGGPRISVIVEAVAAALEKAGQTVDEARRASIADKVKTKEGREGAMKNPAIKAEYDRIRAERATAKAKESAKEAKEAKVSLEEF